MSSKGAGVSAYVRVLDKMKGRLRKEGIEMPMSYELGLANIGSSTSKESSK